MAFQMVKEVSVVFLSSKQLLMICLSNGSFDVMIEMTGAYTYKQNAQEIFENFFGTNNPFAAFGFDTMPFASKLNKPGPAKAKPVTFDLECTLKGEIFYLCITCYI